jgi:hypothetical protein
MKLITLLLQIISIVQVAQGTKWYIILLLLRGTNRAGYSMNGHRQQRQEPIPRSHKLAGRPLTGICTPNHTKAYYVCITEREECIHLCCGAIEIVL